MAERISIDPRISRRRKTVALKRKRRVWLRSAFLVATFLVVWLALGSPLLRVERIRVLGEERTTRDQVAESTGLDLHGSLLLVSTNAVAESVERLLWVKSAEVERLLPDTVRVRVVERRPAAILHDGGNTPVGQSYWVVDDEGVVLFEGSSSSAPHLPVITGLTSGDLQPGLQLEAEDASAVLEVLRSVPKALKGRIAALLVTGPDQIVLSLDDETVVHYGTAENLGSKNAILRALLRRLEGQQRGVAYIDVRVPERPAVSGSVRPGLLPESAGSV